MFFKCYLFQTFRNFTLKLFFLSFPTFSQPLNNLLLIVRTIFKWSFQSMATSTVEPFVAKYLRKEGGNLNEVAWNNDSDKNDDDDDDDDDDINSKDVKVVSIGSGEVPTMSEIPIKGRKKLSCRHERKTREDKSAEQIAKPYQ